MHDHAALPRARAGTLVLRLLRAGRVRVTALVFQQVFLTALVFRGFPGIARYRRPVAIALLIHANRVARTPDFETNPDRPTVRS